jgi:hypothetical protein
VFPPSHAELLSVRGTYKKQGAREEQRSSSETGPGHDSDADGDRET